MVSYLCWQSTSSPGSSPLIPCLQLLWSGSRFPYFFPSLFLFLFLFFLSPLALFFSSPASPFLYLHLFLFLSLHLFESISVAATEAPAATVAWFPALWQKVTLSLAAWKKGRGDEKVEEEEEEEDGWMDVAIETD